MKNRLVIVYQDSKFDFKTMHSYLSNAEVLVSSKLNSIDSDEKLGLEIQQCLEEHPIDSICLKMSTESKSRRVLSEQEVLDVLKDELNAISQFQIVRNLVRSGKLVIKAFVFNNISGQFIETNQSPNVSVI